MQLQLINWASLQARLQNSMLAGTDTPDLAELFEGSMGYFTRGPAEDFGVMDLTDRLHARRALRSDGRIALQPVVGARADLRACRTTSTR